MAPISRYAVYVFDDDGHGEHETPSKERHFATRKAAERYATRVSAARVEVVEYLR